MPESSVLGVNIARLRKRRNLDQSALAAAARITQAAVSALETGRAKDAYSATVRALAGALGVCVDELLDPEAGGSEIRHVRGSLLSYQVGVEFQAPGGVRQVVGFQRGRTPEEACGRAIRRWSGGQPLNRILFVVQKAMP